MNEVELLKPHKHAGIDYQIGDVINVDDPSREWLIKRKIAKPCEPKQQTKKQPKQEV